MDVLEPWFLMCVTSQVLLPVSQKVFLTLLLWWQKFPTSRFEGGSYPLLSCQFRNLWCFTNPTNTSGTREPLVSFKLGTLSTSILSLYYNFAGLIKSIIRRLKVARLNAYLHYTMESACPRTINAVTEVNLDSILKANSIVLKFTEGKIYKWFPLNPTNFAYSMVILIAAVTPSFFISFGKVNMITSFFNFESHQLLVWEEIFAMKTWKQ